jgi:hypothetical protein
MNGLIIEGVTGTGKTSTIRALTSVTTFELFDEDETFGDFMTEWIAAPQSATRYAQSRQHSILDAIATHRSDPTYRYLLERFHPSQYALGANWYDEIDERCAKLHCKVVLLTLPTEDLRMRCLYRAEYGGRDWQDFIEFYGSEPAALEAVQRSQQRRHDALTKSALPHLIIDTGEQSWLAYAEQILEWSGWVSH